MYKWPKRSPRKPSLILILTFAAGAPSWAQSSQLPDSSSIPIKIIGHVGLNVADLQRSADWYERVLGFKIFHKWTTTWMIRRGQMRIGLFLRPNAVKVPDLNNAVAITHFAFITDEKGFTRAQARLTALGIKFDPPEDTGVAHSIFIYDPDGYQVEITTYYKPQG